MKISLPEADSKLLSIIFRLFIGEGGRQVGSKKLNDVKNRMNNYIYILHCIDSN